MDATRTRHVTDPRYWNMIGPFGGWIAAALLEPVLEVPGRVGDPIAITIDFAAAIREGAYEIHVEELRRNRSTSFFFARFVQEQDGAEVHCASATIVLAVRRDTPSFAIATPPEVPPPESLPRAEFGRAKWMMTYDMRFVRGHPFQGSADDDARSIAWVRDAVDPSLNFRSLLAMSDCAFPQIFHRVKRFIPISTVSMTVHFHATVADIAAVGDDFVLYDATMRVAYDGFFDEVSTLYSRAGKLLATMEQIVWYKAPAP